MDETDTETDTTDRETRSPEHKLGTDGLPIPIMHAYRDGAWLVAVCAACEAGSHIYDLGDSRVPVGAGDGFVRAPCDPIAEIGGAYVREYRPRVRGNSDSDSDDDHGAADHDPRTAAPAQSEDHEEPVKLEE